jgi:hypothetical protein
MTAGARSVVIQMADDDPDDCVLAEEPLRVARLIYELVRLMRTMACDWFEIVELPLGMLYR